MLSSFLQGLALGASLIIAIGAQNAFIIRQGIRHQYLGMVLTVCITLDVVLIGLGSLVGGKLLADSGIWLDLLTWAGIAFLTCYGLLGLRAAWRGHHTLSLSKENLPSRKMVLLTTLAVTLLNPHVYLDTFVLFGSFAGQQPEGQRLAFTLGGMSASVIWFNALALFARRFSGWLSQPRVNQWVEGSIGLLMLYLAWSLYQLLQAS